MGKEITYDLIGVHDNVALLRYAGSVLGTSKPEHGLLLGVGGLSEDALRVTQAALHNEQLGDFGVVRTPKTSPTEGIPPAISMTRHPR